jgi:N-acyl-D-aspartate/D-glutamate deacylase
MWPPSSSRFVRLWRTQCDLVIRGGTIYDGRGGVPFDGDVAILGDRIAAVGSLESWRGREDLDACELAVAPGFVNMLSWATESLLEDGRAQSDLLAFRSDRLRPLTGKTLAEVAAERQTTPAWAAMDLVVEDERAG